MFDLHLGVSVKNNIVQLYNTHIPSLLFKLDSMHKLRIISVQVFNLIL